MAGLSNTELMLLEIICEKGEISGYEINRLVEERGYRKWANIGTTSIYARVEKLKKRRLLDSHIDMKKQGKGPLPKKIKINREGKNLLKQEILRALSSCRERDKRFDLGIAGIPFVGTGEAIKALRERKEFLLTSAHAIENKFESEGGKKLPLHTRAVFKHPLFLIKNEIRFTDALIDALKTEKNKTGLRLKE